MDLKKIVFSLFIGVSSIHAKIKLPELATKQSSDKLRFIEKSGIFTYYQKIDGALMLSTNYKVERVLNAAAGTQYQIISSSSRKRMLITQDQNFHTFLSMRAPKNIFLTSFGKLDHKKIGEGISPMLHLKDEWVSFYNSRTKTIEFQNPKLKLSKYQLKIDARIHPYFRPDRVMLSGERVVFTNVNELGIPAIMLFDKSQKATAVIIKSSVPEKKYSLCLNEKTLFVLEKNLSPYTGGAIYSLDKTELDFSKASVIFETKKQFSSQLICNNEFIYFSDTRAKEFNLKTKKTKNLAPKNPHNILVMMDDVLLLSLEGKYYVLKGQSDFSKVDRINNEI